jgi:hypothetical protein
MFFYTCRIARVLAKVRLITTILNTKIRKINSNVTDVEVMKIRIMNNKIFATVFIPY